MLYLSVFLAIWIGAWLVGDSPGTIFQGVIADEENVEEAMRGRLGYIDELGKVYTLKEGNWAGLIGFFCGLLVTAGLIEFFEKRNRNDS
ncbi:hypothetical protein [Methylocystis echinoides]|uniref:hypothetical protein n=1 Tax=Methylocystis echinoides TaxID=29468 RepID=UPI0034371CAF